MNLKIIGSAIAVVILLIASLVALVFVGILPNPLIGLLLDPPEHSARYYPRDTIAYGWLTLYPEDGQLDQMVDLFERFDELPEMQDRLDDLQDDVEDESGFEFEEELEKWIGADISVGLLEENNDPVGVMTVSVRDFGNALVFMEDWTDHLEDEEGFRFDLDNAGGAWIWTDENRDLSFALTEEVLLVVVADDPEDPQEDMLDLVMGGSDRSLAETEEFKAARQEFSNRRFTSAFVDIEELLDLLEDSDLVSEEVYDFAAVSDSADLPRWAALSAQWIDRGLVLEAILPNTEDFGDDLQVLDGPAELVPVETVAILATTFDPDLNNWREQLEEYDTDGGSYFVNDIYDELYWEVDQHRTDPLRRKANPDMADVLDLLLELVEAYTDVDLERDFMEYLDGKFLMSVEEFDAASIEEDPLEETVNAVAMLSYLPEAEAQLGETLEDFSDFLEDEAPIDVDSEDVGADNDAEIFRADLFGIETDYAPGYVLNDGYLVFGTTEDALENAVAAQAGYEENLASLDEYQRAVGALPGDSQLLVWLDLQRIVAELDAEDMDMTDDDFEALEESLGSLAIVSSVNEELIRVGLAITFFPE
ncbi:MAG: DUF3352 domain-containing protein [Chloroflexi bacterium]|nr:DUF3352 domain-containing protein [Chloroflexota bacterium]